MHSVCKSFEVGKLYKKQGQSGLGSYKCLNVYSFRRGQQCGVLKFVPPAHYEFREEDDGDIPEVFQWDESKWVEEPRVEYYNAYKDSKEIGRAHV